MEFQHCLFRMGNAGFHLDKEVSGLFSEFFRCPQIRGVFFSDVRGLDAFFSYCRPRIITHAKYLGWQVQHKARESKFIVAENRCQTYVHVTKGNLSTSFLREFTSQKQYTFTFFGLSRKLHLFHH